MIDFMNKVDHCISDFLKKITKKFSLLYALILKILKLRVVSFLLGGFFFFQLRSCVIGEQYLISVYDKNIMAHGDTMNYPEDNFYDSMVGLLSYPSVAISRYQHNKTIYQNLITELQKNEKAKIICIKWGETGEELDGLPGGQGYQSFALIYDPEIKENENPDQIFKKWRNYNGYVYKNQPNNINCPFLSADKNANKVYHDPYATGYYYLKSAGDGFFVISGVYGGFINSHKIQTNSLFNAGGKQ